MTSFRNLLFRILSAILGLLFLAMAPVIFVAAENWGEKAGVVPILLFSVLFLLKSYRWK